MWMHLPDTYACSHPSAIDQNYDSCLAAHGWFTIICSFRGQVGYPAAHSIQYSWFRECAGDDVVTWALPATTSTYSKRCASRKAIYTGAAFLDFLDKLRCCIKLCCGSAWHKVAGCVSVNCACSIVGTTIAWRTHALILLCTA